MVLADYSPCLILTVEDNFFNVITGNVADEGATGYIATADGRKGLVAN